MSEQLNIKFNVWKSTNLKKEYLVNVYASNNIEFSVNLNEMKVQLDQKYVNQGGLNQIFGEANVSLFKKRWIHNLLDALQTVMCFPCTMLVYQIILSSVIGIPFDDATTKQVLKNVSERHQKVPYCMIGEKTIGKLMKKYFSSKDLETEVYEEDDISMKDNDSCSDDMTRSSYY